jgi:hypothetical protein
LTTASQELAAEAASVTPCYSGNQETNNCKFIFHPGLVQEGESNNGTFDIGGLGCKGITWHWWSCAITILPQTGLPATFVNSGGKIDVDAKATGVKYSQTAYCGGAGTFTKGEYEAHWVLSGSNGPLHVTNELSPVGVYIAEEAKQLKFNAEKYTASLTGTQTEEHELTTNVGEVTCETVNFTGGLWSSSAELQMVPDYRKCLIAGLLATTVTTNSCRYVFHLTNAGPPYSGTADIVCTKAGDEISIDTEKCHIGIPAQKGLGGVGFANTGSGSNRQVKLTLHLEGIKYSEVKGCGKEGTFTDGTYTGVTMVKGMV